LSDHEHQSYVEIDGVRVVTTLSRRVVIPFVGGPQDGDEFRLDADETFESQPSVFVVSTGDLEAKYVLDRKNENSPCYVFKGTTAE
jgi:hypothetical protein